MFFWLYNDEKKVILLANNRKNINKSRWNNYCN